MPDTHSLSPLLRRVQFISRQFPLDFAKATHGNFQRQRVLLEACQASAAQLDALYLVPAGVPTQVNLQEHARQFQVHWGIRLNLQLLAFSDRTPNWLQYYLAPMVGVAHNEDFHPTASLHAQVSQWLSDDADLVVCQKLHAALPLLRAAAARRRAPPVVVDVDDVEHLKLFRELRRPPYWPGKLLKFGHVPALAWAERQAVRQAALSLVCSETDRAHLSRLAGSRRVAVVPNSVNLAGLGPVAAAAPPQPPGQPVVLFVGTYTHRPNVDAAEFLVNQVFPIIRAALPAARLLLVGPRIEALPSFKGDHPGVEFRGFVADLDTVWREAHVMCCTILAGGGTRIKIIESAARGVPVVSTTVGAEGLDFHDGHDILLRDTADGLAQACLQVLASPPLAARLQAAARTHVRQFDRAVVIERLTAALQRVGTAGAAA